MELVNGLRSELPMRDHRRRTEIRRIVLQEDADRIAELVKRGKGVILGPDGGSRREPRWRLRSALDHFAYFSNLPKEFRDANPSIPWRKLARLHSTLHAYPDTGPASVDAFHRYEDRVFYPRLWRFASEELPRIARLLRRSRSPTVWKNERKGRLGIPDILEPHEAAIRGLMGKHGAKRLRVYGSVARGEADARSDVDMLVDWKVHGGRERWKLGPALEGLIGRRVSLFTEEGTYWAIRDRVLSEAVPLFP